MGLVPTRVGVRDAVVVMAVALLAGACSNDPSSAPAPSADASTSPTASISASETPRPEGPAATISQPLTGGQGVFMGSTSDQAAPQGYVEDEYVAAGRATAYENVGPLATDGTWTFRETDKARYRTRVLVRRPKDGGDGTAILEWLNVSGGLDADPAYQTVSEEIVRAGHTWVGVSAQKIGVEGGAVAVAPDIAGASDVVGKGLKAIDPERYGSLRHPGDRFSFDIVTQVARALREGGPVTGDAVPTQVLAMGESQAAFGLVTYVNGVQPLTRAFDGFFVESRSKSAMVMPEGDAAADIVDTILGPTTTFRTDTEVPIFDLQSETDLVGIMGSFAVRQPDTDLFRLWEAAGTAHADLHLVGEATAASLDCGAPINDGPLHVIAKAALRHLVTWVRDGTPPPTAPLIELTPEGVTRDADGLALGGLRTPPVEAPTRVLSGDPARTDEVLCLLFGSTRQIPERRLAELYADRADFEQRYRAALEEAVAAGYVLEEDRAALMAYAHPELVEP